MHEGRACDVLIAGGGPTGLFLAALLAQEGVDVVVLERRPEASTHSRAIGLHPPALAALHTLGLEEAAVSEGVRIRRGVARSRGRDLGALTFEEAWPLRPFVLSLPQYRTEALLAAHLERWRPGALCRGWEVVGVDEAAAGVQLTARPSENGTHGAEDSGWRARVVVGADGPTSMVRNLAGIATRARSYPHTYLMGDFSDTTADGASAVIYLEEGGVVESFPLPAGVRRWVAHTGSRMPEPSPHALARLVEQRTGLSVEVTTNSMISAFGVRRRLATRMVSGRQVVIGDAAHEISPIGGQGMTLGWLDALAVAPLLVRLVRDGANGPLTALPSFGGVERTRLLAARRAARRAELNMAAGRPVPRFGAHARDAAVRGVLATPMGDYLARAFTMRSL